jgi:hypothetical protein
MTDKTTQGVAKKMWDDLDFVSEGAVNAEEATFDMIPRAEADARVAAAYKVVAKAMGDYHWNRYRTKDEGGELRYPAVFSSHTWQEAQEACLSLTPDDARSTLEAMLAEARREERARALDEVSEQWAAALYGMTENGVAALNEKAASELHPEITAFSEWLTDAAIRTEAGD